MGTFVGGLLLMGVSGLAILAYRHHEGYQQIAMLLKAVTWILFFAIFLWNLALSQALTSLIPLLYATDKYKEAEKLIESQSVPFGWLIGAFVGIQLYLLLLDQLPALTGKGKSPHGHQ
jgi:hypothetical protein